MDCLYYLTPQHIYICIVYYNYGVVFNTFFATRAGISSHPGLLFFLVDEIIFLTSRVVIVGITILLTTLFRYIKGFTLLDKSLASFLPIETKKLLNY